MTLPTPEAIARIIDPDGWRVREYNLRCEADRLAWNTMEGMRQAPGFREAADVAIEPSLAKAAAILALIEEDHTVSISRAAVVGCAAKSDRLETPERKTT